MRTPDSILLLDADADDAALASQILTHAYPQSRITHINDALALATALTRAPADVAVIAPDIDWASLDKVLSLFEREAPHTAIVLFGDKRALNKHTLKPGRVLNGLVRKTSAGFSALPDVVRGALQAAPPANPLRVEDMPVAAAFVGENAMFTDANAMFLEALALDPGQLPTLSLATLCTDNEDRERWLGFVSGNERRLELKLGAAAGSIMTAKVQRAPLRSADSRFLIALEKPALPSLNVVHSGRDNGSREMHDIALVFSHDLKEPVQQIMRLVRRLDDVQRGDDPGFSKRVSGQLHTCAERASAMLDSMLEYLAISARDEHPKHVDLNDCLEEALENLRAAIDECHAEIMSARLPVVSGDGYQFVHLFQNLIGNAIKFRAYNPPQIRIDVADDGHYWTISITDNGIGIAAAHCEQVFEMGKRLHTRDEYPGGGIGLTLCRRIVERHGGTIQIEPGNGSGSRVLVRLPHRSEHAVRRA